jgi:hypothetical protein
LLVEKKENIRQISFSAQPTVQQGAFRDACAAELLNRRNKNKNRCWEEIAAVFENFKAV